MYRERLEALNRQIAAMTATDDERLREAKADMGDMNVIIECNRVITVRGMLLNFPGIDPEDRGVGDQAIRAAMRAATNAMCSINARAERYGAPQVFETDRPILDILTDLFQELRAHNDNLDDDSNT